jgi:hypothetical protein
MTIDPKTLPEGAVVEAGGMIRHLNGVYNPSEWGHEVTRVFVPAPEGMTYADAEAALADAGAWVGVIDPVHCPVGARMMNRWTNGLGGDDLYVHRDDLPPTDPDAELVEKMARALYPAYEGTEHLGDAWENVARAALAVVREHEAKS